MACRDVALSLGHPVPMPIRVALLWLAALVGGMPGLALAVPLPPARPVLPWDAPREFAVPLPPARPAILPEARRAHCANRRYAPDTARFFNTNKPQPSMRA